MAALWWVSIAGATGYLGLTLFLFVGLGMLCAGSTVETGSLHNLGIIGGYAAVFAGVWFAAPANPLLKVFFELGALFLFLLLGGIVVLAGAAVYLLDGTLTPFGCGVRVFGR